jgi:site-specific recombinase XerD
MNLSAQFKAYLFSQRNPASFATAKNYLSDVNRFIAWFEAKFDKEFEPREVSFELINSYKAECSDKYSASSVERSASSLRKFFSFLKHEGKISQSPFEAGENAAREKEIDPWKIKDFKNYLYVLNASPLTMKNYVIDVKQFKNWVEATIPQDNWNTLETSNILASLDSRLINDYKNRLLNDMHLSPVSVNRKLSSLRRYTAWAKEAGIIKPHIEVINEAKLTTPDALALAMEQADFTTQPEAKKPYSKLPPVRLAQKSKAGLSAVMDTTLIAPVAMGLGKIDHALWVAKGKPVFDIPEKSGTSVVSILEPIKKPEGPVRNVPKSFYAPTHISTANFPLHKKALHHARYTRPNWYRKYHSYTFVSYLHFSILMIILSLIGYMIFNNFNSTQKQKPSVLASLPSAPNRHLSFQGRITDAQGGAINKNTNLRVAIYSSQTATGSALLWQEVINTTPDSDGVFNIMLGKGTAIPSTLFAQNASLWLGITVERTSELKPRQPIATVAFASNSETLQGLPPITNSTNTANVVLALNSSGNLTIGGRANPTFQATGGTFTLSGNILMLQTNTGSNGNVALSPNGTGLVDIQKAIVNTTTNGSPVAGAVTVNDVFVISAGSTGQGVFGINQTSSGDLIIASTSGSTRFRVDNGGNVTANGTLNGLSVSGGTISSGTWNGSAISPTYGGTGLNTSASTGIPTISSGTWSVQSSLAVNLGGTGRTSYTIGDILYANGSTSLEVLSIGSTGLCLVSDGTTPTWSSCSTGSTDGTWNSAFGALFPNNSTLDFLIGGQSTTAAKFAIINVDGTRGTQTASISGNVVLDSSSANIQTTNGQTLTIGGALTGLIQVNNKSGNSFATFDTVNSRVGIGTNTPAQTLHVVGTSRLDGATTINDSSGNVFWNFGVSHIGTLTCGLFGTNSCNINAGSHLILQSAGVNKPVSIGNPTTSAGLSVRSGFGSNSLVILDQPNSGDILTASSSGITRFSIANNGDVRLTAGISLSGSTGTGSQCLLGGTTASWGSCGSGGSNWRIANGAISPVNDTLDLLIGANATTSAKFAVLNVNGTGPATATVSGNLIVYPQNGQGGNVGIGNTNPTSRLDIGGNFGTAVDEKITVRSRGKSALELLSDIDDTTGEPGGSYVLFNQDAGGHPAFIGTSQASGTNPMGETFTGSFSNALLLGSTDDQIQLGTAGIVRMTMDDNGTVSLGTNSSNSQLYATRPLSWGATGQALVIFDQIENQDILTASASGVTKYVIDRFGNATNSGSFVAQGQYTENTTVQGVHIGRQYSDNTPRILFANGTAAQNWQIDNASGTFRWYLPGATHMSLTSSTFTISSSTMTASSLATFTTAATLGMTSTTTLNLGNNATLSSNATALNLEENGGVDINLGGGSGATGCTVTNSTGAFACSGSGSLASLNVNSGGITNAGAISGATGITSSGTITFSGLTANRFVTSGTGGQLGTSATLANLVSSISDISGSTGTTNLVLSASPTLTGTLTAAAANFSGAVGISSTGTALTLSGAATTAIDIANSGVTTDISLQNAETISNNTDGLIQFSGAIGSGHNLNGSTATFPGSSGGFTMGWNFSSGQGEVDLITRQGAGATGGFRIYDWDGATATNIFQLTAAGTLTLPAGGLVISSAPSTAINISNTGVTTDINLQNGETIQNNTDGRITFGGADILVGGNDILNSAGTSRINVAGGAVDLIGDGLTVSVTGTAGVVTFSTLDVSTGNRNVCWSTSTLALTSAGSGATCSTSSREFKENIEDISYGLEELMKLRSVSFNYKASFDPDTSKKIGFIAEEVAPIIPEVAIYEKGKLRGLNYEYMTSLVVKAVQEQQLIIEEQESKLAALDEDLTIANSGELQLYADADENFEIKRETSNSTKTVSRIGGFSDLVVARIKAGYLELGRLTVTTADIALSTIGELTVNTAKIAFAQIGNLTTNSLAVATENVTIAGTNIRDYIYSIVDQRVSEKQIAISAPITETEIIKPKENTLAIKLPTNDSSSKVTITNASNSAVATFDAEGNASLAGRLVTNGLETNDATVTGTLRASRIVADHIELSEDVLAKLEGISIASSSSSVTNNYITNNYYNSIDTNNSTPSSSPSNYFASAVSSESATLAGFSGNQTTFTNGIMAFGPSSFFEISVADRLFVGSQLSIADRNINVLGGDLELQPLRQGGIAFVGGEVKIDTDGNLKVNGNAVFAKDVNVGGKLAAGIIAPVPGKDLVFELDENEEKSKVEFKTGSNSAFLTFNNKGDIKASGSATFNKLNLSFIPKAIAVNDTEIIATGSAGTAEIKANQDELTINNPLVTRESLIYITPKTSTPNQNVYLLRQVPGKSFTVGLSKAISKSVPFNWIIIN